MGNDYGWMRCRVCKKRCPKRAPLQVICGKYACRLARKRFTEKKRRAKIARLTIRKCGMCERKLPRDRRKYHVECRKQKERERLRIYYERKKRGK